MIWEGRMMRSKAMRKAILALIVGSIFFATGAGAQEKTPSARIQEIANGSACIKLGQSSPDYIRGMALVYARAVCHPERADAKVASAPPSEPVSTANSKDAASVFDAEFDRLKIPNKPDAETMLRNTYVLLTGLGFRESSGRYCVGKYTKQNFNESTSAEAGPFQTSWGAHKSDPSLEPLFRSYQKDGSGCLLEVFKGNAKCSEADAINWNSENNKDLSGVEWQELTKKCPAFAAEYASVVIRKNGGAHGEFGPIKCFAGTQPKKIQKNCKKLVVYPVCDSMFSQVREWIKSNPAACSSL
jgi:hypothetical protein